MLGRYVLRLGIPFMVQQIFVDENAVEAFCFYGISSGIRRPNADSEDL